MLKPMARTTQAPMTMESIIDMNVDRMPHLIKNTKNGRQDVWKVLPPHLTWEKVWEEVYEVNRYQNFMNFLGKHIDIGRSFNVDNWVGALMRNLIIYYKTLVSPNENLGNKNV